MRGGGVSPPHRPGQWRWSVGVAADGAATTVARGGSGGSRRRRNRDASGGAQQRRWPLPPWQRLQGQHWRAAAAAAATSAAAAVTLTTSRQLLVGWLGGTPPTARPLPHPSPEFPVAVVAARQRGAAAASLPTTAVPAERVVCER